MTATGGVDKDDVEFLGRGIGDGVFGDVGGVLAVAFLVQFDFPKGLAVRKFFEVARVHSELLDGAGAEGVAGCY